MTGKNTVQLITYPDSLGGNLSSLDRVLRTHFHGLFPGGVHILPPFPSTSDRGFAPTTHLKIAPEFGSWDDIWRFGEAIPVMLDLMVNHVSAESVYFQDFLERGRRSEYANLFIPLTKVWPNGKAPAGDLQAIFRRRSEPFSDFKIQETGERMRVWTTFGATTPSSQIDIDVNSPVARRLFTEILAKFEQNGVGIVRLDAVGYVTKKAGTSCFFVEPEIYSFLEWISRLAGSLGLEVLPEVHADPEIQFRLAEHGYWIYDFILPYRILEALLLRSSRRLREYLKMRPERQYTMLDCHDGVPIKPDLNGLYQAEDVRKVVDTCLSRGADVSRVFSDVHKDPDGFDVHQILGTFYSLLDCNDEAYLAARAIQFFTPGVPQVYYVGLLAGHNDPSAVARMGDGRELNRHNYSLAEVEQDTQRPVVQRLIRLIRLRNQYAAFDGTFQVHDSDDSGLRLSWERARSRCELSVDLNSGKATLQLRNEDGDLVEHAL